MQIRCKRLEKTYVPSRAIGALQAEKLHRFALVGCISGLGSAPRGTQSFIQPGWAIRGSHTDYHGPNGPGTIDLRVIRTLQIE
jgi:hypothetical protein